MDDLTINDLAGMLLSDLFGAKQRASWIAIVDSTNCGYLDAFDAFEILEDMVGTDDNGLPLLASIESVKVCRLVWS